MPAGGGSCLDSGGFADQTGVAGQGEGGQAPDRGLHTPDRHGERLAGSAVGVEVAACADSGRGQWQSAIQADSDEFHGGARGTDRTGEAGSAFGGVMPIAGGDLPGPQPESTGNCEGDQEGAGGAAGAVAPHQRI